jgi:hypothetical protein
MIRRRPTSVFSLAFLDCICCGFGAIILIFVLSIDSSEKDRLQTLADLRKIMAAHLLEMGRLNISKEDLDRSNARVATLVTDMRIKNDSMHALLDDLEAQLSTEKKGQEAMLVDIDDLKKEIAARQKKADMVLPDVKPLPVGLTIGSNYIAFVIDTSGSMRDPNTDGVWGIAIRKVEEVLDVYPTVKGVQVLDTDGRFILNGGRNGAMDWLPDTRETRDQIKRTLRRYNAESISSPVPGLRRVFTTLYRENDPDMKLGVYVFGDEYAESASSDSVIKWVDDHNPADADGNRRVVINCVAFPTTIQFTFSMGNTGLRYSNLMREICYRNGGTFIGVQDL